MTHIHPTIDATIAPSMPPADSETGSLTQTETVLIAALLQAQRVLADVPGLITGLLTGNGSPMALYVRLRAAESAARSAIEKVTKRTQVD